MQRAGGCIIFRLPYNDAMKMLQLRAGAVLKSRRSR